MPSNQNRGAQVALVLMIATNAMVLLGQVWPEGAPPFARVVNIAFLTASLIHFVRHLKKSTTEM